MTRAEQKAFKALVHAICDVITSGHSGVCTRGYKRHSPCNALNCQAYAIATLQREMILGQFGSNTPQKASEQPLESRLVVNATTWKILQERGEDMSQYLLNERLPSSGK